MENEIYRLAPPKKKGILHLLFSRLIVMVLLLALQLFIIVGFYLWLADIAPWVNILYGVFEIIVIIYLFNNGMDYTAKLSWMFLIAVFPLSGTFFLWFTQNNYVNKKLKNRILFLINKSKSAIAQPKDAVRDLADDKSGTLSLCNYLKRSGCFPIYKNTDVTYFPIGEKKFAAMLEELKKAEQFIFMEYFIIEEGYMWGEILRILVDKAACGVDVRVMYDGMCEISQLPDDYWKLLEEKGIKAKPFFPIRPILSSHYNYRDHRKILVIDGRVAFNGGVNLADEYINRKERFGHWKDTALMLKGDAVKSFTLMFLQMWNVTEKDAVFDPALLEMPDELQRKEAVNRIEPELHKAADLINKKINTDTEKKLSAEMHNTADNINIKIEAAEKQINTDLQKKVDQIEMAADGSNEHTASKGYVMPYGECPMDDDKAGRTVYMDILNRAERYVHIMTPYLILDGELETSLIIAAQRGVDVKIILPGIPDKKLAYSLAKSHYMTLVHAGIKIYEYTPGFVHAKVFTCDDEKAVVGTINLDYRSLYHHFECAAYMYKVPCISDIEKDFQLTMSKCRQVTEETIKNEKLSYKVGGMLAKFIAPLM